MAHVIREHFGADYGLGITGVAGPDTQEGKSVGTIHIAIEGPQGVVTGMGPGWRSSREDNKRFAILSSLNLLRLHLEGVKKGE
jgi:nicotinamide mononucleotide (NMN) deamidase PncC